MTQPHLNSDEWGLADALVLYSDTVWWQKDNLEHILIFGGRLLFRFVLKIFYGTIVVENGDLVPENGVPW